MALLKTINTSIGIDAEYSVLSYEINKVDKYLQANLAIYLNQASREAGKKPADRSGYFLIPNEAWESVYSASGNIAEAVYDWVIANKSEYEGAAKV